VWEYCVATAACCPILHHRGNRPAPRSCSPGQPRWTLKAQRLIAAITFRKNDFGGLACSTTVTVVQPSARRQRCPCWIILRSTLHRMAGEIPPSGELGDIPGADAGGDQQLSPPLAQFDFYIAGAARNTRPQHRLPPSSFADEKRIEPLAEAIIKRSMRQGYISAALLARFDATHLPAPAV